MVQVCRRILSITLFSAAAAVLPACGSGFQTLSRQAVVASGAGDVTPPSGGSSNGSSGSGGGAQPIAADQFCSPLSFSGVVWDPSLTTTARRSFAIALSVSGSFEGSDGWQNITNDFDGTGLSAGLLNQTLGTDSLEPLFATMMNLHPTEFHAEFSVAHDQSITAMLNSWIASHSWTTSSALSISPSLSNVAAGMMSPMDSEFRVLTASLSPTVAWAVANLYQSNGDFVPAWQAELQALLRAPDYVSIQIDAALNYHRLALQYMQRVGIEDLRTYLLMFDFVTQDGSISEARFEQWEQAVVDEKITDIAAKLKALVEIRLLDVNSEWRDDVRSRKYAIIDGAGLVHGSNVNLPQSYCYTSTDPVD